MDYMMSQGVELDDVAIMFYEHANLNSRLREIRK
jgi:hypothetical protein